MRCVSKKGVSRKMWTVVYIAKSMDIAEQIRELLEKDGLLVKLHPIAKKADSAEGSCEVLDPASEVEQAHGLIIDSDF